MSSLDNRVVLQKLYLRDSLKAIVFVRGELYCSIPTNHP